MADTTTTDSGIIISSSIDQLLENTPIGSMEKAISNNMYGINFRQTGNPVPRAKDMHGFTIFTRPQLNLSRMNITNYRGFYNLLTSNKMSYQAFTRLMLDPKLAYNNPGLTSPFVDNQNPFFSILTNNIVSMSGWPDMTVPIHTSEKGLYGEEHSFVDGAINNYEAFDIDATFRNSKGNPLIYMFYIWIKYQALVFEDILQPYMEMIVENEIDYNTRIYRLVLDQRKKHVTQIACTGASFPINVPTGNLFDYNIDKPYNAANAEISIRFRSMGFLAFEDIIKVMFNETLGIFNPGMRMVLEHDMDDSISDEEKMRENESAVYRVSGCPYVKVPHYLGMSMDSSIFTNPFFAINHRAYPYINLFTNELEWWIDEGKFSQSVTSDFKAKLAEGNQTDVSQEVGD